METRWSLRPATTAAVLGLVVAVLGGCGTTRAPEAAPGAGTGTGTPTTAAPPTPSSMAPSPSGARTPPSPLGTPALDSPAPNGGPGAACAGWAISLTPDASGAGTPTGAVAAYLHANRDYSPTPAEQWTLSTPAPGSRESVTARAGATSLELAHLEDGTWLAVSGMRC
ncbi:hypothetical protein [Knoellia locipacati]|nr:hypothetical protein [Knoellia locipacati]